MAEPNYRACAAAGFGALHKWYNASTGLWQGTGWWNAANALTAVIRYTKWTGDTTYQGTIQTTFTAAQKQHANFINNYYDDNGWWALAWIEAYDLTRNSQYLQAAQTIFTANAAACGGTRPRTTRTRSSTSCSSPSPPGCISARRTIRRT